MPCAVEGRIRSVKNLKKMLRENGYKKEPLFLHYSFCVIIKPLFQDTRIANSYDSRFKFPFISNKSNFH